VVRALDVWPARRREFRRRRHASAEQGGLGEDDPNRWAPSVSDGGTVTGGRPAHAQSWAGDQRGAGLIQRKRLETLF
jgi:putative intracellular protease/amidase